MSATPRQSKLPSERSFGFVWTAVFAVIGLWPLFSGEPPRILFLAAAVATAAISLLAPRFLRPLNMVWFRFGLLLHKVVSPIVLGAMFFFVVTPVGLIMRLSGKNLLQRRKPDVPSYWQARAPVGAEPGPMRDQF